MSQIAGPVDLPPSDTHSHTHCLGRINCSSVSLPFWQTLLVSSQCVWSCDVWRPLIYYVWLNNMLCRVDTCLYCSLPLSPHWLPQRLSTVDRWSKLVSFWPLCVVIICCSNTFVPIINDHHHKWPHSTSDAGGRNVGTSWFHSQATPTPAFDHLQYGGEAWKSFTCDIYWHWHHRTCRNLSNLLQWS